MKIKPNFSELTVKLTLNMHNGYCCVKNCTNRAIDMHHKLHNTKLNNKKYPVFLQSIFNCAFCCREHHENYSLYPELNITENEGKMYEKWLQTYRRK